MRSLFVHISHGAYVRTLLYSGLIEQLASSFRIVFLTWPEDVANLASLVSGRGDVLALPYQPRFAEKQLQHIRRYVMVNPKRGRTISVFSLQMKVERPLLYFATRIANRVIGRWAFVRRMWLALDQSLVHTADLEGLLRMHKPVAVVSANYGTDREVSRLFIASRRQRIVTISVVPSWDNLSSKGVMSAPPDHLIVWNEIMRREALEMHDFTPERVRICGPLQFDIYARATARADRATTCRRLGVDPDRPFIVFGTITPRYFPYNWQVIRQLAQSIANGEISPAAQVVIRLHPQVVRDPVYGENLQTYQKLTSEFEMVKLNVPDVLDWKRLQPPAPQDPQLLADMLHHAAVCIVPGSTLAIDAVAAGCPAIGLAYDGDQPQPYERSIRRWYDYTYFQPLLQTGGMPLASSREDLIRQINAYLADRNLHASERAAIVEQQIGHHDGHAVRRVADGIQQISAQTIDG